MAHRIIYFLTNIISLIYFVIATQTDTSLEENNFFKMPPKEITQEIHMAHSNLSPESLFVFTPDSSQKGTNAGHSGQTMA